MLRRVCAAFPDQVRHRPAAEGFSLVEHVWHLAELEVEAFGVRIERLLHEREPYLEDYDGDAVAKQRDYLARPLAPALAALTAARAATLRKLAAIRGRTWLRSGVQEHVGFVMLGHLPEVILAHDRSHALELADLLDELVDDQSPRHPLAGELRTWCAALPRSGESGCRRKQQEQRESARPASSRGVSVGEACSAIAEALPTGEVTTRRISRALGLSPRTLQRQLSSRGVSVRCLVEETRRHLAMERLRDGAPVSDVAAALGFSDARALSRAFKRWTGATPSASRTGQRLASGRC